MRILSYFFCFPILQLCRLLKSLLIEDKHLFILLSQYPSCWWPGDARSQGISRYSIDIVFLEYSGFSTTRVKKKSDYSWNQGHLRVHPHRGKLETIYMYLRCSLNYAIYLYSNFRGYFGSQGWWLCFIIVPSIYLLTEMVCICMLMAYLLLWLRSKYRNLDLCQGVVVRVS